MNDWTWPLPPYLQVRDFLQPLTYQALIDWMIANEEGFGEATVVAADRGGLDRIDPEVRVARTKPGLGPMRAPLETALLAFLPDAVRELGISGPEPDVLELELAAHGDGAHFAPHLDIPIGEKRRPLGAEKGLDRILSAVVYLHREPKAFRGGALRLHRFGELTVEDRSDPKNYVDIEPIGNSLIVFPSWVMHEVRRVECPSGEFRDYRFALNCWFCRKI